MNTTHTAKFTAALLEMDDKDKRYGGHSISHALDEHFPDNMGAKVLGQFAIEYSDCIKDIRNHLTRQAAEAQKGITYLDAGQSVNALLFFCTANDHHTYVGNIAKAEVLQSSIKMSAHALGLDRDAVNAIFTIIQ